MTTTTTTAMATETIMAVPPRRAEGEIPRASAGVVTMVTTMHRTIAAIGRRRRGRGGARKFFRFHNLLISSVRTT
jgi:hypothetical protein